MCLEFAYITESFIHVTRHFGLKQNSLPFKILYRDLQDLQN